MYLYSCTYNSFPSPRLPPLPDFHLRPLTSATTPDTLIAWRWLMESREDVGVRVAPFVHCRDPAGGITRHYTAVGCFRYAGVACLPSYRKTINLVVEEVGKEGLLVCCCFFSLHITVHLSSQSSREILELNICLKFGTEAQRDEPGWSHIYSKGTRVARGNVSVAAEQGALFGRYGLIQNI